MFLQPAENPSGHVQDMQPLTNRVRFTRVDDQFHGYVVVLEGTKKSIGLFDRDVLIFLTVQDQGRRLDVSSISNGRKLFKFSSPLVGIRLILDSVPVRKTTLAMKTGPM